MRTSLGHNVHWTHNTMFQCKLSQLKSLGSLVVHGYLLGVERHISYPKDSVWQRSACSAVIATSPSFTSAVFRHRIPLEVQHFSRRGISNAVIVWFTSVSTGVHENLLPATRNRILFLHRFLFSRWKRLQPIRSSGLFLHKHHPRYCTRC